MSIDVGAIIEKLKSFSTPELCDSLGMFHAMHYSMKPLFSKGTIVGRAVTIDLPTGSSKIVNEVIATLKSGDVLVVAARGNCESACWGDFRSTLAKKTQRYCCSA